MKAFTLIELLVVVAIIGILAAVGVTTFGGFQEKAKKAAVKSNHKLAVKQITTEITGAEIRGKMKKWDNGNPGSCILVDIPSRSDLWVHIGLEAFNGAGTWESSSGVEVYFEHGNSMSFSIGTEVEFFGCQNASVSSIL